MSICRYASFLLLLTLVTLPPRIAKAQDAFTPLLEGYVTTKVSDTSFEINGRHVLCDAQTKYAVQRERTSDNISSLGTPYLGELMQVFGRYEHGRKMIRATRVVIELVPVRLSGHGVIDRILTAPAEGEHLVRADGYPLLVQKTTTVQYLTPLRSAADIGTNVWVDYAGTQRADGVVVLSKAVFRQNMIAKREEKLREKSDYDPESVPADAHQGSLSKAFVGIKTKEIPPYGDDAMQARVRRIGENLIPAYQRVMPDSDPGKIRFRFEVIDEAHRRSEYYYPGGVLLVPRQVVERMQNDDQLAEIIASGIAATIEKQDYSRLNAHDTMKAGQIAADVGGAFVPGLGLAALGANAGAASHMERIDGEQRRRVSLSLMHDAGYDLDEAPKAWWLLASKKPKSVLEGAIPLASLYLYAMLGLTWHDTSWQGPSPRGATDAVLRF